MQNYAKTLVSARFPKVFLQGGKKEPNPAFRACALGCVMKKRTKPSFSRMCAGVPPSGKEAAGPLFSQELLRIAFRFAVLGSQGGAKTIENENFSIASAIPGNVAKQL